MNSITDLTTKQLETNMSDTDNTATGGENNGTENNNASTGTEQPAPAVIATSTDDATNQVEAPAETQGQTVEATSGNSTEDTASTDQPSPGEAPHNPSDVTEGEAEKPAPTEEAAPAGLENMGVADTAAHQAAVEGTTADTSDGPTAGAPAGDTTDTSQASATTATAPAATTAPAVAAPEQIDFKVTGSLSGSAKVAAGMTVLETFKAAKLDMVGQQVRDASGKVVAQGDKVTAEMLPFTASKRASGG